MAAAYLRAACPGKTGPPPGLDVARRHERGWAAVTQMARRGVNAPLTSSAGRLFDAAAAILGVRDEINYEGQAAVELEQLASPGEAGAYPAGRAAGPVMTADGPVIIADGPALIRAVCDDVRAGTDRAVIAARFHNGLAALVSGCCEQIRERAGLSAVALSGGVFQNLLLLNRLVARLEARGFTVLTHSRVPCNDGGISFGQAAVAAALARRGGEPSPASPPSPPR
jgi:hydrogenase maturation protein HypF